MSKQEQKKKTTTTKTEKSVEANTEVIEKGKQIKKDVDELLDRIDDVLEENAEEFVKNYIQKNGE